MAQSRARNQVEFAEWREVIVAEVRASKMHYNLYVDLRAAIPNSPRTFNRALHFWHMTLNGNLEAARISLARLFDQESKSVSLRNWLRSVEETPDLIETRESRIREEFYSRPLEEDELERDIKSVESGDELILRLVKFRNNAITHRSRQSVSREVILNEYALTYSEYEELIKRGEDLLNRYSVLHDGCAYVCDSMQPKDFEGVVRACEAMNAV